jgi:hypothetical protein
MIGFSRNDQDFEPETEQKPNTYSTDLDFDRMWDEGLSSTSVEFRTAHADATRYGR